MEKIANDAIFFLLNNNYIVLMIYNKSLTLSQ